jgi:DNA invertase Pin-like site-specific DNA recombinase
MMKAALYARVSTGDTRHQRGTGGGRPVDLRDVCAGGAAEYIDDGYTGTLLDRPALNRMRSDLQLVPESRFGSDALSCVAVRHIHHRRFAYLDATYQLSKGCGI